jgi:hypothetical protein
MVDKQEIKNLLGKHFVITGHTKIDPQTGVVDVDGDVKLRTKVKQLPATFGQVSGNFDCYNDQLSTLAGAPKDVGGEFSCHSNQLSTLEGAPLSVSGDFWCGNNQLTTLEGAPKEVVGSFYCDNNQLYTLAGAPLSVGGNFWCYQNPLTTLEGAPNSVERKFVIDYNPNLPLLRLLQYKAVRIHNAPTPVKDIMTNYAGTGKRGMLGAGVELTRAGFKANARW